MKRSTFVLVAAVVSTQAVWAQTFTTLTDFSVVRGWDPGGLLVQGTDGNFYGTASQGGGVQTNYGTVYKLTPAGALTPIYEFCTANLTCPDGFQPLAGLALATNGAFYGSTAFGGTTGSGTFFDITLKGALTTLVTIGNQSNFPPQPSTLVQAINGLFYGTTFGGGASGYGTVFRLTSTGVVTTLYSFTGGIDGGNPTASLVQGTNGELYGASNGVATGLPSAFFEISPAGVFQALHSFATDEGQGINPLIQGSDGSFYGTAFGGGLKSNGDVFRVTAAGRLGVLYNFCEQAGCVDGSGPTAGLVQGTDGNFYGTTQSGGVYTGCGDPSGCGTIFEITPAGGHTVLHSFCAQTKCLDGYGPNGLIQGTDGNFYGTTANGGPYNNASGTAFRLSVGLGPFVSLLPATGKTGATVKILGTDLTGTSSVSFSGVSATYTVVSPTQIVATAPAGTSTGSVQVVTPNGTLTSNTVFHPLP